MLRFLFLLLFSLAPLALRAEEPYFCYDQGRILYYERRTADDGKLKWQHRMSIDSIEIMDSGSSTIKYSSLFTKPNGNELYGGPVRMEAAISSAGDVSMDLAATVVSALRNFLPDKAVSAEVSTTVLPSRLMPGDVLPDASCTVSATVGKMRIDVSERRVLRFETISTPAGEFDCIVVSEHKVEKGLGRRRVTTALTWYSRGVGMVRHDTYDEKLELETSEILVKFERI